MTIEQYLIECERRGVPVTAEKAAIDVAAINASIARANDVDAGIELLKQSDPAQFEQVRRLSFIEQAALFGL